MADADVAHRLSPHDPDTLKLWGDALDREGHWKDALTEYNEALQYAPAWADLHQARERTAQRV
jgi:Flp pilus assembly protein TadD